MFEFRKIENMMKIYKNIKNNIPNILLDNKPRKAEKVNISLVLRHLEVDEKPPILPQHRKKSKKSKKSNYRR